jgi:hypothetical protein
MILSLRRKEEQSPLRCGRFIKTLQILFKRSCRAYNEKEKNEEEEKNGI